MASYVPGATPPSAPPSRAKLILQAISRAYFARERQRLGIGAEERADAESGMSNMLKRVQLARLLQQMQLEPGESDLKRRLTEAQVRNLDEPNRAPVVPPETPEARLRRIEAEATARARGTRTGAPPAAGGGDDGGAAANPFIVTVNGQQRLAVRDKGVPGGLRFVDKIGGESVGPGPTADMRNVEYQSQAVEPAFELVGKSLDSLEAATAGIGGSIKGVIPGTDANFAKSRFVDQAKALLGAIVARQAGEGSRLSDEDRRSYSQAATLVNNLVLLPGGITEARERLNEARTLINTVIQRRRVGGDPGAPSAGPADPAAAQTRVINGVTYTKVPGGWKRQ